MVLLIDTNVIIDFLCKREPFFDDSLKIIKAAANNKYNAFITANSITDIIYLLRKSGPIKEVKKDIYDLLEILNLIDITKKDIESVLLSDNECDLEDELIYQCAKKTKCDYIVTRDEKGFKHIKDIKICTPEEFLTISK